MTNHYGSDDIPRISEDTNPQHPSVIDHLAALEAEVQKLRGLIEERLDEWGYHCGDEGLFDPLVERMREALNNPTTGKEKE